MQMTISRVLHFILQLILVCTIKGELQICFKFNNTRALQNSGAIKDIPQFLEKARTELKNDINESLGTSQSSNYTYFNLYVSHSAVTLEGNLTNGWTTLSSPTMDFFTLTLKGLEIFNLTFPNIYINGSYDLSGYIGENRLFDIYGKGDFEFQMINFSIAVTTTLKFDWSEVCVPIATNVYLKDFKSNFANFMNGDEELDPLINGAIQSIVPDAVSIILREDADFVDPFLQWIIDNILKLGESEALLELLHVLSTGQVELDSSEAKGE